VKKHKRKLNKPPRRVKPEKPKKVKGIQSYPDPRYC